MIMRTESKYVIAYADKELVLTWAEYKHVKKLFALNSCYVSFEHFAHSWARQMGII